MCVCVRTTSQISPDGPHPDPTNKKQTTTKAHYDNPPPLPHTPLMDLSQSHFHSKSVCGSDYLHITFRGKKKKKKRNNHKNTRCLPYPLE